MVISSFGIGGHCYAVLASHNLLLVFSPQPFDSTRAWSLLNCGYLRLTASNIATLEEICSKDGYDVSAHPHKHVRSDSAVNTDVVFKVRMYCIFTLRVRYNCIKKV